MRLSNKLWIPAFAGMTALALLAMTYGARIAQADDCVYQDGGYCVSFIAKETATKLGIPTETAVWGKSKWGKALWATEGPLVSTAYLNYYESIWNQIVKDGKATQEERDRAFAEAGKAGGTKIGGVNLVVLGARTLQQLVDKGVMTKEEAQGILDKAREGTRFPLSRE